MAIFRLEAKIISRGGGKSTVASAAYRTGGKSAMSAAAYRAGEKLTDERTGETYDYTHKRGILGAEVMLPATAPGWMADRQLLWNHIETVVEKRKDAQLAYDYIISIPHELSPQQRIDVIRDFVREQFVDKGFVADVAWHAPSKSELNVHAHVMVSMRRIENGAFTRTKDRSPAGTHPMGAWQEKLRQLRLAWEQTANRHLEAAGLDVRIDHRSLADRGLEQEPQPKLGPVAAQREKNGQGSHAGDDLRAVRARNAEREQLKVELAEAAAVEAEIVDFIAARERRAGMTLSPEDLAKERVELIARAAEQIRTDELEAEERLKLDAQRQLERIEAMKAEQQAFADQSREQLDAIKEENERRRLDGKITSAEARYAIAAGETVSSNPYDSLIRAAGAESAAFLRGQEEMRQQLADPALTGPQRQEVLLRKEIEYLEYRALTDERLAGMYRVIGGREHLSQANVREWQAEEARDRAQELRAERRELLRQSEQEQAQGAEQRSAPYGGPERRETDAELAARQQREFRQVAGAGEAAEESVFRVHNAEAFERFEYGVGQRQDRRTSSQSGQEREIEAGRGRAAGERTDRVAAREAQENSHVMTDEDREMLARLEAKQQSWGQEQTGGRQQGLAKGGGREI